jgi:predicted P-loop ATPase
LRIRIVTYWGTGNKDNILTDETGNSRFLVFRGRISSHDYNNRRTRVCTVPLERLWAQVFSLYKSADFEYELTKEEKEFRDRANKRYEVTNDTVSSVLDYFEPGPIFWSVTKIARYLAKESPIHKFSSAQLIAAFKKINEIYKEANKDKPENEQKPLYELEEVYGQKGFKVRLLEFSHGESNPF